MYFWINTLDDHPDVVLCVWDTGNRMLVIRALTFIFRAAFSLFARPTSTMMTHSTSTMLRPKRRLATMKKQKRYGILSDISTLLDFLESFEMLWFLTTAISFFSVFSADSEWKVQEWLRLSQLACTLLYVSKSSHVISSYIYPSFSTRLSTASGSIWR